MLQIILLILKILGIILLVLLGLILTVLVLILLVPIRYRLQGDYNETPRGLVTVTWLLHLLSVRIVYDGQTSSTIKVLGFRLFQERESRGEEDVTFDGGEDGLLHMTELDGDELLVDEAEYARKKPVPKAESAAGPPGHAKQPDSQKHGGGTISGEHTETAKGHKTEDKLTAFAKRLGNRLRRMVGWLINRLKNIVGSFSTAKDRFSELEEKYRKARDFLENEENRKTFRLLRRQTKRLFFHLLPGKIKGRARFGFDDPYRTGQVLTAVSPFYGFYAKSLSLEPAFDEEVLEGELKLKGRIRLGTLIVIVLRMLANKNFRVLLKKLRS